MNTTLLLALCIVIAFLPGIIGASTMGNQPQSQWYLKNKPSFTPPGYVFPIVWNALYLMMGISLFYIVQSTKGKNFYVLGLFAANLLLNGLWSPIFFKYQMFKLGYTLIILMICLSVLIIIDDAVPTNAKALLVPYVLWLSFASVLNLHFVSKQQIRYQN